MKIVFLDASTLGSASLEPIRECGELITYPTSTRRQALERVRDAEVIITNKVVIDEELLEAAPSLKLICEAATGVNNIDLAAAAPFSPTPQRHSWSCPGRRWGSSGWARSDRRSHR